MLEAIHYVRRGIIAKLTNAVTINGAIVPVFNRMPTNSTYPVKIKLHLLVKQLHE